LWLISVLLVKGKILVFHGSYPLVGQGLLSTITLRHTTLGRPPLDVGKARNRDVYLTTHTSHKRETSTPPAGFKPTILESQQLNTQALNRAATETAL